MQIEYRRNTKNDLLQLSALLCGVFHTKKLSVSYLEWLYFENPAGQALGYNAWCDGQLVAHYALVPKRTAKTSYLLSVNTCTHHNYNGLGLFKNLAAMSYDLAKQSGHRVIVGVANKNSIFGFKTRLGFLNPFSISVYIASGSALCETMLENTLRSEINWRLRNPGSHYFVATFNHDYGLVFVKSRGIYVYLASFLWEKCRTNLPDSVKHLSKPPTVFLLPLGGISPDGLTLKLPNQILPSPWHVIVKCLNNNDNPPLIKLCGLDMDTF